MNPHILLSLFLMFCSHTTDLFQKKPIAKKPNILLFIADDCTFRDLACYGGQNIETPNIDKLAKEGMKFTNCHQASAMCSPTRHNLLTGLYPVRSGAYPNHTFVKEGVKSIVHYLSEGGYNCAQIGKTHINPKKAFPFNYLGDTHDTLEFDKLDTYLADNKTKDKPFFMYVCSNQPHAPYTHGDPSKINKEKLKLPANWVDTKQTRNEFAQILAEVNYMDWEVGQCLELLKKHQLDENTIIVFTSEQGNGLPFSKWTCYNTGLQSGFIMKWLGKIAPNTTSNALIEYVDITPTLVDIANNKTIPDLDGKSFLPILLNKKKEHKKFVFGLQTTRGIINGSDHYGIRTVRDKKFRYILNLTPEVTFQGGATDGGAFKSWQKETGTFAKQRVQAYLNRPFEELYDEEKDPYEMNNLAENPKYAKQKLMLKKELSAWMTQQGDEGAKTEMEAFERQTQNMSKKGN